MRGPYHIRKYSTMWLAACVVILALSSPSWARTDVFFVAPQTVVAEPGQEATLTIYVKAERLRAFGFTLLLDTRYITFVPNSLLKTELSKDFDFIGANLIEDEVYDENRPYLKELIIGGSVLEPVSSVWDDHGTKHGVAALATFKVRLVDGFSMPPEGYLPIPVATDKTVNDFTTYRQGGGILFFKQPGQEPPLVRIVAPGLEARVDDANVTLEGEVALRPGQELGEVLWIDPFKIKEPSSEGFVLGHTTTITVDFSGEAPTIQTVFFAALDTDQNGVATGTIFGINEDVIVEYQGEIKGIVRNATLLEPISGAEVILYERTDGELRRIKSVFSGTQGTFYIDNIGKGTYTLIANKEGFQEGSSEVVLATDNATVEDVVIELFPLGRPTGDVYTYTTGKFCVEKGPSGSAARGFKVEDITGLYSCTTGADGCCEIDGLRKGQEFHYMWHATGADGYTLATVPQAVPEDGLTRLVAQSQDLTTLEVQVLDPVTLLGVEGVNINVKDPETGTEVFTDGPTGPSGTLEFHDLEPWTPYTIEATLTSGNFTHWVSEGLVLDEGTNHLTLYLHGFELDGVAVSQDSGGRLVLQVLDGETLRPIEVAPQKIALRDPTGSTIPVSSKDGHYEAGDLPAGNYTLSLAVPGYVPVDNYNFAMEGRSSRGIIVYLHGDSGPTFSSYSTGQVGLATLKGLLLSMDTLEPIWNALVTLEGDQGDAAIETRTNALGQFAVRDLVPGGYELTVEVKGYQRLAYRVMMGPGEERQVTMRLFPEVASEVTVTQSSNTTSVLHGVVLSSVLDFSPTPVTRATVRGIRMADGAVLFQRSTDSAGNFVVHSGMENEPFRLEIEAPGYEARSVGPIQLSPGAILFKAIYLVPKGAVARLASGGIGGEVAEFIPEGQRLFLFGGDHINLATIDDTYGVVRTLDSMGSGGVPQKSIICFGPEGDGTYALAYSNGSRLEVLPLERTFGRLGTDAFHMIFSKAITSLAFRYPMLLVSSGAGLTAVELYSLPQGLTPLSQGMPRILWHLDTVRPAFAFTHPRGIVAVEGDGVGYFVETLSANVPVIKDQWALSFSPMEGSISGDFGIFCDLSGVLVPVRQVTGRGHYTRGRGYEFSMFKKAQVFTIPHPLNGYQGKEMALALILEEGGLDLVELTDLNLWLLRRYPVTGVEDMFTSRLWREYVLGQDRYEGAVYLVGPRGVSAIAMPRYLGVSNAITATWDQDSTHWRYVFTNKGYVFDLNAVGQDISISFDAEPGTYDVYLVRDDGTTRLATSVSSFGRQVADMRRRATVNLETISYPGGPTRVFHGGDIMGISIKTSPQGPLVVDGYLLTSVDIGGVRYRYYWQRGTDGAMLAYPYGPDVNNVPPKPLVEGLYLDDDLEVGLELVALPKEVGTVSGQMSFILLPAGARFDENATQKALGQDQLNFSISGR